MAPHRQCTQSRQPLTTWTYLPQSISNSLSPRLEQSHNNSISIADIPSEVGVGIPSGTSTCVEASVTSHLLPPYLCLQNQLNSIAFKARQRLLISFHFFPCLPSLPNSSKCLLFPQSFWNTCLGISLKSQDFCVLLLCCPSPPSPLLSSLPSPTLPSLSSSKDQMLHLF